MVLGRLATWYVKPILYSTECNTRFADSFYRCQWLTRWVMDKFHAELQDTLTVIINMFDYISRQAIYAKTHSLCHLCEAFGFDLVLERICREVCAFAMDFSFDQCKGGTDAIQLDLLEFG